MNPPVFLICRSVVEARSPLSIGAGDGDNFDLALVRDANGLPFIPASTIKGLLKRYCDLHEDLAKEIFGYENEIEGSAGLVEFGPGCILDENGEAVIGLRPQISSGQAPDPILAIAAREAPIYREHVALNHRHVTDERGKFDRSALPTGTRFALEFSAWEDSENGVTLELLRKVARGLSHPALRMGGASARGYGRIEFIHSALGRIEVERLADAHKLRALRRQPPSDLSDLGSYTAFSKEDRCQDEFIEYSATLTPIGLIRVGGGGAGEENGAARLLKPVNETRIIWNDKHPEADLSKARAVTKEHFVIPGSAIRGPLVHRALFHFNRLNRQFAESVDQVPEYCERGEDLATLFGEVKGTENKGLASLLIVNDSEIVDPVAMVDMAHNSIDRFSGGVRNKVLFSERVLYGGTLEVSVLIKKGSRQPDKQSLKAFELAWEDLCNGRLAIGAKGLGFMQHVSSERVEKTDA